MKLATLLLIILSCILSLHSSAYATSADFKLTVRIPAIIGVNVAPAGQAASQESAKPLTTFVQATIEEVIRDGEKIVLQTFSVK